MAKSVPRPEKQTLDKDLDKITLMEQATHQGTRGFVSIGLGGLFLVVAMALAAAAVMGRSGAGLVVAAAAAGAYMAMNTGANDVTNNMGPAVGARAMSMTTALIVAAICEAAGAMIAGSDVISTISTGIVYPAQLGGPVSTSLAMLAALLAAALWVNIATYIGAPVSTTHAIVGAVVGAGIAAGGMTSINWALMSGISVSWVVSPLLGGMIAACVLAFINEFIIYREDKIAAARRWVPVLIGVMAGAFAAYLALIGLNRLAHLDRLPATLIGIVAGTAAWGLSIPIVAQQAAGLENRNYALRHLFKLPLAVSAALLSFAHGANDVANAIAPLSAIVGATLNGGLGNTFAVPLWVMVIGAFGISAGLMLFGPRLIRLVGEQITKLNPMRAYCVSLSAALTVIVASWVGLPVSSTHIAIGAVFGVGFFREWYSRHSTRRRSYIRAKAQQQKPQLQLKRQPKAVAESVARGERNVQEIRRRRLVRRSHFMTIVAAWVITVPVCALASALLYAILTLLLN